MSLREQNYRVLSKRSSESKLIESQALSTSLLNPSPSSLGEPECSDLESWDLSDANIVGDSPDEHSNLVLMALHIPTQSGQRERSLVDLAHAKPVTNHLAEMALGPSVNEVIKLKNTHRSRNVKQ